MFNLCKPAIKNEICLPEAKCKLQISVITMQEILASLLSSLLIFQFKEKIFLNYFLNHAVLRPVFSLSPDRCLFSAFVWNDFRKWEQKNKFLLWHFNYIYLKQFSKYPSFLLILIFFAGNRKWNATYCWVDSVSSFLLLQADVKFWSPPDIYSLFRAHIFQVIQDILTGNLSYWYKKRKKVIRNKRTSQP